MQHTYLRYECADVFSLATSSSTTSTLTTSPLAFLNKVSKKGKKSFSSILLSTAGSQVVGFNLRTNEPCLKIGHRELLSGGLGTGRALNSNEVLCITTSCNCDDGGNKVATGWKDGSIRIFDVGSDDIQTKSTSNEQKLGLVHSLLFENEIKNEEFIMREPLVLNGHSNSAVTCLTFDDNDNSAESKASRLLASGSSDGRIILWDIIAETGLFRLLGHRGPITDLSFSYLYQNYDNNNASANGKLTNEMVLLSSSLDGLVKIWNMESQCCVQTIANHNGQVTCSSVISIINEQNNSGKSSEDNGVNGSENDISCRSRFITGCIDGKVRVWSIHSSKRRLLEMITNKENSTGIESEAILSENNDRDDTANQDDICSYMGILPLPPNTVSNEKIQSIQYHTSSALALDNEQATFIGVLRSNTKHIDVYLVRNLNETIKKKIRRLRRKREKDSLKQQKKERYEQDVNDNKLNSRGKKRGLLDDKEDDEEIGGEMNVEVEHTGEKSMTMDDDQIKASDEFEYVTTIRSSHKIKAFTFTPNKQKKGGLRIVLALATNALEVHSITTKVNESDNNEKPLRSIHYETNQVSKLDMYGHPTGIRSIALSSDDTFACTVSKNMAKVWNVNNRSCLRSLPLSSSTFKTKSKKASFYGLCVTFLPGDTHFVVGTREGHLLIVDIASGDIVYFEEKAHEKEIWSVDLKKPKLENNFHDNRNDESGGAITIMTGSADKSVKFWEIESQTDEFDSDEDEDSSHEGGVSNRFQNHPMLVHVRTLQTTDDVVACRYSHDPTKRMVFVSTLDSQIKVFFDDTLKFFLSLYGHSLPALALDASDDDVLLASGGADKSIKIWGLDFGDTHRTLYGHSDSITDLKFVKKTHNFFTCSKDTTVRYWDGDRFQQILLLSGHSSEINCLGLSKTGAYLLSGGMGRQVRVWERTKDMVFLEEEKERELEAAFDKVDGREEKDTAHVLRRAANSGEDEDEGDDENEDSPQSEAAVKQSVLSVSSGDRIMEALERADQESKEIAMFNSIQKTKNKEDQTKRTPNILLMGMDPPAYILWVLRSIKSAELEQSLLILPLGHMQRLLYYLILLLRKGEGVELCSRAAVFLVKSHQNQIIYGGTGSSNQKNNSISVPLRELRRLLKLRLNEARDTVGYNIAAMRMVIRVSKERKNRYYVPDEKDGSVDIWKGLGRL